MADTPVPGCPNVCSQPSDGFKKWGISVADPAGVWMFVLCQLFPPSVVRRTLIVSNSPRGGIGAGVATQASWSLRKSPWGDPTYGELSVTFVTLLKALAGVTSCQ